MYANRVGKMRVGSMVLAKPAPKPAHTKKQAAHLAKVKELAKASREAKKEVTVSGSIISDDIKIKRK